MVDKLGIYWDKDKDTYSAYVQVIARVEGSHFYVEPKYGGRYNRYDSGSFNPADRFKQVAPKELAGW